MAEDEASPRSPLRIARTCSRLLALARNRRAALALTFALSSPVLCALVGGVIPDATALLPIDTVSLTPVPMGGTQPMRIYRIISDNTRPMLETVGLPSGGVGIDAPRPVADKSAYTAVVARQVNLYEGPNPYLDTNDEGTGVPMPKGVGPLKGRVVLAQ